MHICIWVCMYLSVLFLECPESVHFWCPFLLVIIGIAS